MPQSLRIRLVASYSLVVLLCLATAALASAVLLRDYQREIALNRLSDLLGPLAFQARVLERTGTTNEQLLNTFQEQARDLEFRLLLVEPDGDVVLDTGGTLDGMRIALPDVPVSGPRPYFRWSRLQLPNGERLLVVGAGARGRSVPERLQGASTLVVLAAPDPTELSGLRALAPSIWPAAVLSLVASIAVGLFLSQTIARPVADLTQASEAMARGDYRQEIPVRGDDELGRLARAFNAMAKQVAASDRAMRDFVANVSHDLRTPLTSIRGFAQAIADGTAAGTESIEVSRIIVSEAERLTGLVEDILLLSRLESGQTSMAHDRLELASLLQTCAARFRRQADERGIRLHVQAEQATVVGDAVRLEQAVSNLIDNAVKFTPDGGEVAVSLSDDCPSPSSGTAVHRHVRIKVRNSGSTIPQEEIPRVFERFYQADPSRTHRTNGANGSGLGLAIVREIALSHGGSVTAESVPGQGTTFELTLPMP